MACYQWTLFSAKRSQCQQVTENWVGRVENTSGERPVQVFIYDNARESLGKLMQNFNNKNRITVRTGVPYVSAHRGRIERAGRTLMDSARACGIAMELPDLLPTSANPENKSLVALMFEKLRINIKPTIVHLRTWGCVAYSTKPEQLIPRTLKMSTRAWKGRLVGIEGICGRIYKVWLPKEEKVIHARDVSFDENDHKEDTKLDGGVEFEVELVDPEIIEGASVDQQPVIEEDEDEAGISFASLQVRLLEPTPTPDDILAEEMPLPVMVEGTPDEQGHDLPVSDDDFVDAEDGTPAPIQPIEKDVP
ncbi:hypothetical protein S7711_09304 [Stachybotrys chartarum IBT 7711]|uniref:Retroviral polymerase SH3-like domain-containing protein n=1 Tax=Stachybotrys chartarum (strain CBS 109288 / IBT 7711) TaxID=1280523 RepID=A0A084BCG2_STACB|nr:hypothetical protein S7711_09304 [Stachybotrys chartarum IBT 7711]